MATAFLTPDVEPVRPFAESLEPRLIDSPPFATPARPSITRWRSAPPVLVSGSAWLREPERRDADALWRALSAIELDSFVPDVLSTTEDFERFIAWTRAERIQGRFTAFVVGECGDDCAAGLFEAWPIDAERGIAEWRFSLDHGQRGAGLFIDAAPLLIDFMFDRLGMSQLEARLPAHHDRGSRALRKLGARRSGQCLDLNDHGVWVIDAHRWRAQRRGCNMPDLVEPAEAAR